MWGRTRAEFRLLLEQWSSMGALEDPNQSPNHRKKRSAKMSKKPVPASLLKSILNRRPIRYPVRHKSVGVRVYYIGIGKGNVHRAVLESKGPHYRGTHSL